MSMDSRIGKVCSKAFRRLYNMRQIKKYMSAESTKSLIRAFVTSLLDLFIATLFCISLRNINMTDFNKFLMRRLELHA